MADDTVLTIIQSARRVLKLSQFEVADQLGIGRATYQRFEQGKSWLPIPKIQQLARILGVSPGVLGLADPQPYVAGDDLLRMWWGLFYSGRTDFIMYPFVKTEKVELLKCMASFLRIDGDEAIPVCVSLRATAMKQLPSQGAPPYLKQCR